MMSINLDSGDESDFVNPPFQHAPQCELQEQSSQENGFAIEDFCADTLSRSFSELNINSPGVLGRSVKDDEFPFLIPPDSDTDTQSSDDDSSLYKSTSSNAFVYPESHEEVDDLNDVSSDNGLIDSWEMIDDEFDKDGAKITSNRSKNKSPSKNKGDDNDVKTKNSNNTALSKLCSNLKVPLMHVAVLVCGTRGDVQPFLIIAQKLKSHGHRVRFATHELFRSMVKDAGLEFYPLAGDPKKLSAHMVETGGRILPLSADEVKALPEKQQMLEDIMKSTLPACVDQIDSDSTADGRSSSPRPFKAQAIISNPVTYGHIHVAEYLDVPLHLMFPQPWCPTSKFPHPLSCIRDRRYYFSTASASSQPHSFSSQNSHSSSLTQEETDKTSVALSAASSAASSLANAIASAKAKIQGERGTGLDPNNDPNTGGGGSSLDSSAANQPPEFKPYELSKSIDLSQSTDLYYDAKVTNWLSYFMADQFVWLGLRSMVNSFRVTLHAKQREELTIQLIKLRQKASVDLYTNELVVVRQENEAEDEHDIVLSKNQDCCVPTDFLRDWVNTSPMWNPPEEEETSHLKQDQKDTTSPQPPIALNSQKDSTEQSGLMQEVDLWVGMDKIRAGEFGANILNDLRVPFAKMWSPSFVAAPEDYGSHVDVIGNVFPPLMQDSVDQQKDFEPPEGLLEWLAEDAEDLPIFVGFGSMVIKDTGLLVEMIEEAALEARVRVILQSSWTSLKSSNTAALQSDEVRVFHIGSCPHEWLFPRVSGVLHHGGAGTVAAGLRAGKPTLVCPFFGDQFFWGMALERARVGLDLGPIAKLTVSRLADGFRRIRSPRMLTRAILLSKAFAKEDGAQNAVEAFYKHLPLDSMVCEVSIWLNSPKVATLSMQVKGQINKYHPSSPPCDDGSKPNQRNSSPHQTGSTHFNSKDGGDGDDLLSEDDPLADVFGACLPMPAHDRCFPTHGFGGTSTDEMNPHHNVEHGSVSIILCEQVFDLACSYKAKRVSQRFSNQKKPNSKDEEGEKEKGGSSKNKSQAGSEHVSRMKKSSYCLDHVSLLNDVELHRSVCKWGVPPPRGLTGGVYQGTVGFVAKSSQAFGEAFVRPFSTALRAANDSDGGVVSKVVDGVGGFVSGAKHGIPESGRKIKGAIQSLAGRRKQHGKDYRVEELPRCRRVFGQPEATLPPDSLQTSDNSPANESETKTDTEDATNKSLSPHCIDHVMHALDAAVALKILWCRYYAEEFSIGVEGSKYLPLLLQDLGYGDRAVGDAVANLAEQWREGFDLTPSELAACLATTGPPPNAARICRIYGQGSHRVALVVEERNDGSSQDRDGGTQEGGTRHRKKFEGKLLRHVPNILRNSAS